MFSFLRRKQPRPESTDFPHSMTLINGTVVEYVVCRTCDYKVSTNGLSPLSMTACGHCGTSTLVPRLFNGYWLFESIGVGGMGRVYKAVHRDRPGTFAVKLLPSERRGDQTLIDALYNEAQMTKVFQEHPNVVTAVEFGREENEYFLCTEFIDGERWDRRISRIGRMPEHELLPLISELLKLERFIFRCGYLYRDLKPENVLITGDGIPKVIDFGLCRSVTDAQHNTTDAEIDGAPHFMPPERLTGEGENVWSEIYSLGMLMYYSLTGQTFFASGDVQGVAEMYATQERDASVLRDISWVSPKLADIVEKSIQRRPTDRYHSFDRIESDLREVANRVRRH